MKQVSRSAARFAVMASLIAASMASAGPLDPPAGPVASTPGPEPRIAINATNTPGDLGASPSLFKITQPGSYYLTGNITGVGGKHGIEIAASNVTLDLNGFALTGVPGSLSGIFRNTSVADAFVIRNGVVASWGDRGLDLALAAPSTSRGARLESIIATQNASDGFAVPDGAQVEGCVATRNAGAGFFLSNNACLTDCIAQGNSEDGFFGGFGCTFLNCQSRGNTLSGFMQSATGTFSNCSATNNSVDGFSAIRGTFVGCVASFNTSAGFRVSISTLESCSVTIGASSVGIVATASNYLSKCFVNNGNPAIDVTGADNRIDSCSVNGATIGIRVTGTGNLIVRNSSSATTPYSIVANNSAAPIVNSAGMATLTNPMANFDF